MPNALKIMTQNKTKEEKVKKLIRLLVNFVSLENKTLKLRNIC